MRQGKVYILAALLVFLVSYSKITIAGCELAGERVRGGYWEDVKVWAQINNGVSPFLGLSARDHLLMTELRSTGYLSVETYNTQNPRIVADTVSVWAYLAEMGLAILNNWDDQLAHNYLVATAKAPRYYGSTSYGGLNLFRSTGYGQGRLINSNSIIPQLAENAVLPMNFNSSYAYFLAVKNKIHKRKHGIEQFYESSIGFNVYQYLHTQITKIPNPKLSEVTIPGTALAQQTHLTSWKYKEGCSDDPAADDISHGGLVARAIAFGADENYSWRWWANSLFIYSKPMVKAYVPQYIDMTNVPGQSTADSSKKSGLFFWDLPYP